MAYFLISCAVLNVKLSLRNLSLGKINVDEESLKLAMRLLNLFLLN